MATNSRDRGDEAKKSYGERFRDHALGPMGLGSIVNELKFAIADIRHKVVEEGWFGRAVTPRWYEPAMPSSADGGIHGPNQTDTPNAGGGIHGKAAEASAPEPAAPDRDGGVHGAPERTQAPEMAATGVAPPEHERSPSPAEETGLGMSYAELEASWMQDNSPDHAAPGRDRERAHEPDQGIEP